MKILVLQLARLGDIYMTWPVVRALKRAHPGSEIHMMVRPRFHSACVGLTELTKTHLFETEKILSPLFLKQDLEGTMNQVDELIENLQGESFDRIINLSFSPVSSYITQFLSSAETQVSGYSRHADGYLHLTDDVSRYFWAQVGPGFPNRVHVVDLLAGVAGVDLSAEDFKPPQIPLKSQEQSPYFVVHIGASERHKQISPEKWVGILRAASLRLPEYRWILVGAPHETFIAEEIEKLTSHQVVSRVGQTNLEELFALLAHSQGLIGADSAPMHMVPFVNQKALCFSSGRVNFWETGPITLGSFVLRDAALESEESVADLIESWSREDSYAPKNNLYKVVEALPRFENSLPTDQFEWDLVRAIYMGSDYPLASDLQFYKGCLRLYEANQVAIENLRNREKHKKEFLTSVLDRVDEIFVAVAGEVSGVMPLFRWYQAEKTRIQPGTFELIAQDTLMIHEVFHSLLKKYLLEEDVRKVEGHGSL